MYAKKVTKMRCSSSKLTDYSWILLACVDNSCSIQFSMIPVLVVFIKSTSPYDFAKLTWFPCFKQFWYSLWRWNMVYLMKESFHSLLLSKFPYSGCIFYFCCQVYCLDHLTTDQIRASSHFTQALCFFGA